jgi:hypothetical protein
MQRNSNTKELTPSLGEAATVRQAAVHLVTRNESYSSSWYLCPATMPNRTSATAVLVIAGWRPQPALASLVTHHSSRTARRLEC